MRDILPIDGLKLNEPAGLCREPYLSTPWVRHDINPDFPLLKVIFDPRLLELERSQQISMIPFAQCHVIAKMHTIANPILHLRDEQVARSRCYVRYEIT